MSNSNADLGTTLYKDIIQKLLDNNTSAMQTQILTEKEKAKATRDAEEKAKRVATGTQFTNKEKSTRVAEEKSTRAAEEKARKVAEEEKAMKVEEEKSRAEEQEAMNATFINNGNNKLTNEPDNLSIALMLMLNGALSNDNTNTLTNGDIATPLMRMLTGALVNTGNNELSNNDNLAKTLMLMLNNSMNLDNSKKKWFSMPGLSNPFSGMKIPSFSGMSDKMSSIQSWLSSIFSSLGSLFVFEEARYEDPYQPPENHIYIGKMYTKYDNSDIEPKNIKYINYNEEDDTFSIDERGEMYVEGTTANQHDVAPASSTLNNKTDAVKTNLPKKKRKTKTKKKRKIPNTEDEDEDEDEDEEEEEPVEKEQKAKKAQSNSVPDPETAVENSKSPSFLQELTNAVENPKLKPVVRTSSEEKPNEKQSFMKELEKEMKQKKETSETPSV